MANGKCDWCGKPIPPITNIYVTTGIWSDKKFCCEKCKSEWKKENGK